MKVTFIDPCDYRFYANQLSGPLGLAYMGGYIDDYFDGEVEVSIEVDVEQALKNKPDIIGISAYTETFNNAINAAKYIKNHSNIPVLIGGKHITALPSNLKSYFDVGVIGDGEITSAKLIESYIKNHKFLPEELINIQGVAFRDNNDLNITPQRPALRNLDDLAKPKRDIMHAYWPNLKKEWEWPQGLYTSRGCPYKCPFCIHSKLKFVSRFHSAERVVEEIQEIIRNYPNQKLICIYDDLFVLRKDRLREIVELIDREKINRKVSFNGMCKSNHFDEEIAYLLKKMNMRLITFGFESGDEKTLQYLKKDSSTVQENLDAINLCNKYGIRCGGYFIIGSPPETKKGLTKSYWFIRNNYPPMSLIGIYSLTPFPGTATWDQAKEKGFVNEDNENWDHYNYLKYQRKEEIFLNENYDYSFFKDAYENYIMPLNGKNQYFSLNDQVDFEVNYYNSIFEKLNHLNLNLKGNILEITNSYAKSFSDGFNESLSVKKFDHWSLQKKNKHDCFNELDGSLFDLLVFNHSLEQMKSPLDYLSYFTEHFLDDSGEIIIFIKNQSSIVNLGYILSNIMDYKISGFKAFDNLFLINHNSILKSLNKLKLTLLNFLPLPINIGDFKSYLPLVSLASKNMNVETFLKAHNIYGYIIHLKK